MGGRLALNGFAPDFERRSVLGDLHVHARDRHRTVGQARIHPAGHDADAPVAGKDLVAGIENLVGIGQYAEDLEPLAALQPLVLLGTAKAGLARRDGEIEPSSHSVSPGGWSAKGYIWELS